MLPPGALNLLNPLTYDPHSVASLRFTSSDGQGNGVGHMNVSVLLSCPNPAFAQTFTYTVSTSQGQSLNSNAESSGAVESSVMTGFSSFGDDMVG